MSNLNRITRGASCALLLLVSACQAGERQLDPGLKKHFGEMEGCFLMRELDGDASLQLGGNLCSLPKPPCSTFKIVNTLIALDSGVIEGPDTVFEWDQIPSGRKAWDRNHTLKSAFTHSVLWYYQRLAGLVGRERMQLFLSKLDYGDQGMSDDLTGFWLDGSLTITAGQQLDLITSLYRNQLPFTAKSQEIVRSFLNQLWGKTGTCLVNGKPGLGWFVGHAHKDGTEIVYVTLIQGEGARGSQARRISQKILKDIR